MRCFYVIVLSAVLTLPSIKVYAGDEWIHIKGKVNPALTKVVFENSAGIAPVIFYNDHHAINKCYKIRNGYLTFIESGEGLFKGYELDKKIPEDILGEILLPGNEKVTNHAGLYIGMVKQEVKRIIGQSLLKSETRFRYQSVEMIEGVSFDVVTSLIIGIDGNALSRISILTSITN